MASIVFTAMLSLLAQRFWHISLEVVPLTASAIAMFLIVILRSLDEQTLRSITFALLVGKRDALLKSVVESSSDCILCIDPLGRVQMANAAAAELFGFSREQLLASFIDAFLPDLFAQHGLDDRLASVKGRITEQHARTHEGISFPVEISISAVNHKDERLYTVIVRDIRERKAQEQKLQHQATHDALTGLPNRHLLALELERELELSPAGRRVGLLVLDLTRFKEVNDTLGHNFGDIVLCEVAQRFQVVVEGKGLIARMGGDEFTVLCPTCASEEELAALARHLSDALRTPIIADAVAIELGVNIGIACYPEHARDSQTLLKNADVAMYSAKRAGQQYAFYDASLDEHSVRKLAILGELRSALESHALELHFQPQVNLRTQRVESVEALLRWQHPRFGPMSPMEFITVAESTDLVRPLTEWTIIEALTQLRLWDTAGIAVRVAVNLSARMLQDLLFPNRLASLLATHQVRPGALELEITESAMMIDSQRALEVVTRIHDLGVYVSIDDYGTGFSSLAYLRDLPVHSLKLDRSFLSDLQTRDNNRVIVESTVAMAHALKLHVVAEGVETEWQEQFLTAAGYDYGQGYRYSKAMPADECRDWMLAHNARLDDMVPDEIARQILLEGRG
jgi:diguanylate cyclase (GGDEF)-like protein/PAS domain S-box-containing protein